MEPVPWVGPWQQRLGGGIVRGISRDYPRRYASIHAGVRPSFESGPGSPFLSIGYVDSLMWNTRGRLPRAGDFKSTPLHEPLALARVVQSKRLSNLERTPHGLGFTLDDLEQHARRTLRFPPFHRPFLHRIHRQAKRWANASRVRASFFRTARALFKILSPAF